MMTGRSAALDLLKRALARNEATFRHGQWKAIDALVNRQERLLIVQRTGWGKISVYFIVGSEEAPRGAGLVRRSNGPYGFPADRFRREVSWRRLKKGISAIHQ